MSVKDCCKKEENLIEKKEREDLIIKTCKVCGCRHFRLIAEKGMFFGKVSAIGKNG